MSSMAHEVTRSSVIDTIGDDLLELILETDLRTTLVQWPDWVHQQRVVKLASVSTRLRRLVIARASFWGRLFCTPSVHPAFVTLMLERSGGAPLILVFDEFPFLMGPLRVKWESILQFILVHIDRVIELEVRDTVDWPGIGNLLASNNGSAATRATSLRRLSLESINDSSLLNFVGPTVHELRLSKSAISAPLLRNTLLTASNLRELCLSQISWKDIDRTNNHELVIDSNIQALTVSWHGQPDEATFLRTYLASTLTKAKIVLMRLNGSQSATRLASEVVIDHLPSGVPILLIDSDIQYYKLQFPTGMQRIYWAPSLQPQAPCSIFDTAAAITVTCGRILGVTNAFVATFRTLATWSTNTASARVSKLAIQLHFSASEVIATPEALASYFLQLPSLVQIVLRVECAEQKVLTRMLARRSAIVALCKAILGMVRGSSGVKLSLSVLGDDGLLDRIRDAVGVNFNLDPC